MIIKIDVYCYIRVSLYTIWWWKLPRDYKPFGCFQNMVWSLLLFRISLLKQHRKFDENK